MRIRAKVAPLVLRHLPRIRSGYARRMNRNLDLDLPSFVTHLECSLTGERYPPDQLHGLSRVGRPLLVRYDLSKLALHVHKDMLKYRSADLWRYREFLPVRHPKNIVSLGEVMTPILSLPNSQRGTGVLWVKDESRLPTGSFKARGIAMAVSMAKELGVRRIAMPTNGNAGAALAAYASRAGIESFVFCPNDTPEINVREIAAQGARTWRVNGLIHQCGQIVAAGKEAMEWYDMSTLKEPYRIEGKKTMGLELAEQFDWQLPKAIFYPTGGGTGLIGMWKAFDELRSIGWLHGPFPKMFAVQATGCAPIVRAFEEGVEHAPVWENATTIAAGIRVPVAVGDFLILRAVRESGGQAIAVDDVEIIRCRQMVALNDGLLMCPEGAATYAAYLQALERGSIRADDSVLLYNCASGLKYPLPPCDDQLDITAPIAWDSMRG